MESQIHQLDARAKENNASNAFAQDLDSAWGKGGLRQDDFQRGITKPDLGQTLDFSSNIYGSKIDSNANSSESSINKYDGKADMKQGNEKEDIIRQKKLAALKQEMLDGGKKVPEVKDGTTRMEGKVPHDGGKKVPEEANGSVPMEGKVPQDGGPKPAKPQEEFVKPAPEKERAEEKPFRFYPDEKTHDSNGNVQTRPNAAIETLL